MFPFTKRIKDIHEHPIVVMIGMFIGCASLFDIIANLLKNNSINSIQATILCIITMLFSFYIYSYIKLRTENKKLKNIAEMFEKINYTYKESLFKTFYKGNTNKTSNNEKEHEEKKTLQAICFQIGEIYRELTNKRTIVTIKWYNENKDAENKKQFAQTLVRSQKASRDDEKNKNFRYEIGVGDNTAFDIIIKKIEEQKPKPCFHSNNLKKEKDYKNQREDFLEYYKNVLLVPIYSRHFTEADEKRNELIGFLCIDTKSINRINNKHHLTMLRALAGQMFNYLSFMRGTYTIP